MSESEESTKPEQDLEYPDQDFYDALDNVTLLRKLVSDGRKVAGEGPHKMSVLHYATYCKPLEIVAALLPAALEQLNKFDEVGKTPLTYAAMRNDIAMAEALIRAGSELNTADEDDLGMSPLAWAIEFDCSPETVRYLLDAGADPGFGDPYSAEFQARCRLTAKQDSDSAEIVQLLETSKFRSNRPVMPPE